MAEKKPGEFDKPGSLDEAKGRARTAYGELTGDESQKSKGTVEKVTGKIKEGAENLKEKAEDFIDRNKSKR